MLTRIRNAIVAEHTSLVLPNSKLKLAVLAILKEQGFIQNYDVIPDRPQSMVRVWPKYTGERKERRAVISGLKRVSSPGCRIYVGRNEIPWVHSGLGVAILSTPKGVVTGRQARKMGVGGEVLCYVW
jgi:small subunit ribosomal protein S8